MGGRGGWLGWSRVKFLVSIYIVHINKCMHLCIYFQLLYFLQFGHIAKFLKASKQFLKECVNQKISMEDLVKNPRN